ncbi:MAG: hypothetical protein Q4F67_02540 [Propionibacteriaceae bacterium]|nr:hypothetical protein [Propionibacteriaceae bacterium]
MSEQPINTAAAGLDELRQVVSQAKSVPMSASCVVNRAEILELIDRIRGALPEELGRAQGLLANSDAEAERILSTAREEARRLVEDHQIAQDAQHYADTLKRETETECEALRRETDIFIDSRMASFESVLHKTTSQVATARSRLAERSALDEHALGGAAQGADHHEA